jgi:hypothetical protein
VAYYFVAGSDYNYPGICYKKRRKIPGTSIQSDLPGL